MISNAGIRLIELSFKDQTGTGVGIGIDLYFVRMGEVALYYDPERHTEESIARIFEAIGFTTLRDQEEVIIERIRIAAIELIYYANNVNSLIRNSDYISEKLEMPYDKLSRIFSRKTGRTLETYIVQLKIEKVKQLISNQEYSLSEIAYMMGYSSVQYLSNQFKKVTGITVTQYKDNGIQDWVPIEQI